MSQSKEKESENVTILLTPGGIKSTLEKSIKFSRDLKNTMHKTQGLLHVEFDASGAVVNVSIKDENGETIGNAGQIAGIGGVRRFILDATKEAEKETADHEKISVAKNMVNAEGIKVAKLKPEANGRVSELIRMAKNAKENRLIMEQWDDEGIDGRTRMYLLKTLDEVLNIVKEEAKAILKNGKTDKEFVEQKLSTNKVPRWFYNKLTTKTGVSQNMSEPIDFLFPKNNYQNGVHFRFCEINDIRMCEKHWMITSGNEELFSFCSEFMDDFIEPAGRDAKRQAQDYLKNLKVLLVPKLKSISMIERYKDSKHKSFEQNKLPEGEAGHSLRRKVTTFTIMMDTWHEYFRYIMFKETDAVSFWKKIVDPTVYGNWNLTTQQNVKYWVNELEETDLVENEEWQMQVYHMIIGRSGIYDPKQKDEFLIKYAHRAYLTCEGKHKLVEENKKDIEAFDKDLKDWKDDLAKMPESTDEEKAEKEIFKNQKPVKPPKLEFADLEEWSYGTSIKKIPVPATRTERDDYLKANFSAGDYERVFNMTPGGKVVISKEDEEKYLKFFRGISMKSSMAGSNIGIADRLTKISEGFMEELKKNERYGKALKPKVENWLTTTFVGTHTLQEIAAEAVVTSLQNQDFYEEAEE